MDTTRRSVFKGMIAAGTLPIFNIGCAGFGLSRARQIANGAKIRIANAHRNAAYKENGRYDKRHQHDKERSAIAAEKLKRPSLSCHKQSASRIYPQGIGLRVLYMHSKPVVKAICVNPCAGRFTQAE